MPQKQLSFPLPQHLYIEWNQKFQMEAGSGPGRVRGRWTGTPLKQLSFLSHLSGHTQCHQKSLIYADIGHHTWKLIGTPLRFYLNQDLPLQSPQCTHQNLGYQQVSGTHQNQVYPLAQDTHQSLGYSLAQDTHQSPGYFLAQHRPQKL